MADLFRHFSIGDFINEPEKATDFEVTRFEEMDEPEVDDVHKHSFYEVLWVDAGGSRQTIDFQSYDLGPQSLFFISPGQVHEFEAWQPLRGGTIMFTSDFFRMRSEDKPVLSGLEFLDNAYVNPELQLAAGEFQEIRHTIELLISENRRPDAQ